MTEDIDRKLCCAKALRLVDSVLDERERQIIRLRYGLGEHEPMAQREVAQKMGISRSYVSRLEKSALDKLHRAMTGKPV
jgi:RNA polymerase sporulation-specific sigma factor